MSELNHPISGPTHVVPKPVAGESPVGFELQPGVGTQIASSISEEGSIPSIGAGMNVATNRRDFYTFGAGLYFGENDGTELHPEPSSHFRALLRIGQGEAHPLLEGTADLFARSYRNRYLGYGKLENFKTLEIGSDIFAADLLWRPAGGPFAVSLRPALTNILSLPTDEEAGEKAPLLLLSAGVTIGIGTAPLVVTPPPIGIGNGDVAFQLFSELHRLLQAKMTADALAGDAAVLQDYTQELFGGNSGLPSPRTENLGMFNVLNATSAAGEEGRSLSLQLRANESQRPWLIGSKAATTLGAFLLSPTDDSTTMLTQGVGGGMELLHLGLAQAAESDSIFLLTRALTSLAPFAIGWGLSDEKFGQALLSGSHQSLLSAALDPAPKKNGFENAATNQGVAEWNSQNGWLLGFQSRHHLGSGLFTNFRLLAQTAPNAGGVQDEVIDPLTGRDPRTESAKAQTVAAVGWESSLERKKDSEADVRFSVAGRAVVGYGDAPKPLPGVGLQAGLHVKLPEVPIELGLDVSADVVDGELNFGVSPAVGWRTSF